MSTFVCFMRIYIYLFHALALAIYLYLSLETVRLRRIEAQNHETHLAKALDV